MTSRLKHKLELENVNLNSAYLNESFVQIGTPLPALSEHKKDKQEYVPEWQQEVRDEQGRRRFHGAFTGGFSAGYYNTVGSKEGWAPSTFKSSRSNRANKVQRAEDFMDEEDLEHMREDRKLENTDTFKNDGFAGTREELGGKSLPSAIESLIAPSRSSIGEKLLQKLGWRPGQGIGPRVPLRKLKLQQGKLGKARAGIDDDEDEQMGDDTEGSKHTFAPRDVALLTFDAKEDKQGLGFAKGRGMGPLPVAMGARQLDDDDYDPYAEAGPSSRPLAFDGLDDDDEVIVMGGSTQPGLGSRSNKKNRYSAGRDLQQDTWHDGRPVLKGFALDPKGVPQDKWFALPDIPPDWRPRPARVWGTIKKWDQKPGEEEVKKEVIRGEPGKPLTFEQRGAALGEEQRTSKAKSVFEYMSSKDRERLASIASTAAQPPSQSLSLQAPPEEEEVMAPAATEVDIPPLSPRTASAALKGFIPYGDDLEKQDRYKSYLTSQTYNTTEPDPILKKGTFEEINKELRDFSSSARIFRPMSYAMSNRFTSGSSSLAVSDLKQAKPGLHIFDAEKAKLDLELGKPKVAEVVEAKKNLTPREQAAANGMYGKMTRETRNWYPTKLICRRWSVKDPHPEGDPNLGKDQKNTSNGNNALETMRLPTNDASWESKFIHQPTTPTTSTSTAATSTNEGSGTVGDTEVEKQPTNISEVGMANDINQGRDILTYEKPSIDIFKAIFASDDEDEDDDEEEEDKGLPGAESNQGVVRKEESSEAARYEDPFPVKEEGPVDIQTFKPVFTLRKEDNTDLKKKDKEKKKEKSKKRKGVLSFDVGDEGEDEDVQREEKKKKKKERDRNRTDGSKTANEGGDEEWVEKPSVVPRLVGRKGAADFM
nr:G patch domain-containing protein 1 [Kwoniella mangroviensis CBS 8507]OCF67191.1 G patch domain-containing protein 1 [Kwoniella mangroviensis CBS 8507]